MGFLSTHDDRRRPAPMDATVGTICADLRCGITTGCFPKGSCNTAIRRKLLREQRLVPRSQLNEDREFETINSRFQHSTHHFALSHFANSLRVLPRKAILRTPLRHTKPSFYYRVLCSPQYVSTMVTTRAQKRRMEAFAESSSRKKPNVEKKTTRKTSGPSKRRRAAKADSQAQVSDRLPPPVRKPLCALSDLFFTV